MPSPQRAGTQVVRHGALGAFELLAPASQTSPSVVSTFFSLILRPPRSALFPDSALFGSVSPSSHCSPLIVSMMPLPQVSFDLQSAEQLSPETLLPSSQTSP